MNRQVPHRDDYDRPYCTACHFVDRDRCSFCHCSMLSKVQRLNLTKLGPAVLAMSPRISAAELLTLMNRYTISDDAALEINRELRLYARLPSTDMCELHSNMATKANEVLEQLTKLETVVEKHRLEEQELARTKEEFRIFRAEHEKVRRRMNQPSTRGF